LSPADDGAVAFAFPRPVLISNRSLDPVFPHIPHINHVPNRSVRNLQVPIARPIIESILHQRRRNDSTSSIFDEADCALQGAFDENIIASSDGGATVLDCFFDRDRERFGRLKDSKHLEASSQLITLKDVSALIELTLKI
jgi:hypothetical protein